jgi:hypothetical protein
MKNFAVMSTTELILYLEISFNKNEWAIYDAIFHELLERGIFE